MNKMLTKIDIERLIELINTQKPVDSSFVYDVYDIAYQSIQNLQTHNILKLGQPINSISLFYYIIGEYTYSVARRTDEEILKFNQNEAIKIQMASVVADKYMSSDVFKFQQSVLANKYLPPISSLEVYTNFMINLLSKCNKNNPTETLIIDLLNQAVSSIRCILRLLCEGYETSAMATWRTLHESECILIVLDKYGDDIVKTYLKHMRYGVAFRGALDSVKETDDEFVKIKGGMKAHNLKSKDMKKFIEYGWLYETDEGKNEENFKLNFRDGLEHAAGLDNYSKIYEQSSEIVHSTPMLIYSNNLYYYMLTLTSTYESFFRIEDIFSHYCFKGIFESIKSQYEQMKKVYYSQLISIYKTEVNRFKEYTMNAKQNKSND